MVRGRMRADLRRVAGPAITIAIAAALTTACAAPRYYAPHPCDRPDLTGCLIRDVEVTGAKKVSAGDIKDKIATTETSHALGGALADIPIVSLWDRLTVDYSELDHFVLERDLTRIERFYRARGYYEAHARAARVTRVGKDRVRVEIVVEEGEPVVIAGVRIEGKDKKLPDALAAPLSRAARVMKRDAPFSEATFETMKKRLLRAMTDNGYAYASVEAKATVDLITHKADVEVVIDAGPLTTFGPIRIEGAGGLPESRLRQAIAIVPGEPYSTARLESSQSALSDLRVFGSVEAAPEIGNEGERPTAVPVVFRVTPTPLKTVKMGAGFELGTRVATRGVASWENRNFLGGLRTFTVEGKPGIVFFPYNVATLFGGGDGKQPEFQLVPEMRLHTALVQPGFLEARTRGNLSAGINLYQIQNTSALTYFELAGKAGLDRGLWDGRVQLGLSLNMQFDVPLDRFKIDSSYDTLLLPLVNTIATLDYRHDRNGKRDPINPNRGFYLSNEVQIAFGDSKDIRVRPEIRGYIPVTRRVTLALRAAAGFLHVFGGDFAASPTPTTPYDPTDQVNDCRTSRAGSLSRCRWIQLLQLRGFNSGGTNSNRGYGFNGIGPQEPIPGVSPKDSSGAYLPVATGGKALWEASVELRFPVWDKLGLSLFVDGSDVRQRIVDFGAPFAPHLSTGLGIRYATPVGPLRVDIGLRVPGLQVIGLAPRCGIYDPSTVATLAPCQQGQRVPTGGGYIDPVYGQAGSLQGVPLAISLAIGEAF